MACLRLFEAAHPGSVPEHVGNHPNGFFNNSVAILREKEKKSSTNKGQVQGSE